MDSLSTIEFVDAMDCCWSLVDIPFLALPWLPLLFDRPRRDEDVRLRLRLCVFLCCAKLSVLEKCLPHMLHEYGRSNVCVLKCLLRCSNLLNRRPHWGKGQVYTLSVCWWCSWHCCCSCCCCCCCCCLRRSWKRFCGLMARPAFMVANSRRSLLPLLSGKKGANVENVLLRWRCLYVGEPSNRENWPNIFCCCSALLSSTGVRWHGTSLGDVPAE